MPEKGALRTALLTTLAMIAFAANSLLCRLALGGETIDAASFTTLRLASGALMLWLVTQAGSRPVTRPLSRDWLSAAMLFLYAVTFSFAYTTLSTGTGALILFGAVQLTMFLVGLRRGEHFSPLSWTGLAIALAGLVYLLSPGISAPDPFGALLMVAAGIGWGVYSLRGQGASHPLHGNARNFLLALPMALLVSLVFYDDRLLTPSGMLIAIFSGAVASGLGYIIWYAALKGLSATGAATVQLSVPVIAAFGGVMLLSEAVTTRLIIASAATLGGVALALTQRRRAGS
ncbi:MAG: DMT family transporter [Sedimenticola sp.]|nr:DMT family transporter [Sedimenticola sp.]